MNACLSLLASLWAEDPTVEDVPELLQASSADVATSQYISEKGDRIAVVNSARAQPRVLTLFFAQPIARKLVKECGGSPLAVRLVAPLLEGSSKERKWKEVQAGMVAVAQLPHRLVRLLPTKLCECLGQAG